MHRALVSLSGLALCLVSACGVEREDRHPDVLFLLIDTLRADRLGCYGYERPTSPVIDSLAERGAVLTRTSAQAPWTLPSMFSEPVLYHHTPMDAPERTRYGAMMTHLADDLAHHALGPRRVSNHEILGHPMLIHLGLHTVDMDRLLIKQEEICETIESMD